MQVERGGPEEAAGRHGRETRAATGDAGADPVAAARARLLELTGVEVAEEEPSTLPAGGRRGRTRPRGAAEAGQGERGSEPEGGSRASSGVPGEPENVPSPGADVDAQAIALEEAPRRGRRGGRAKGRARAERSAEPEVPADPVAAARAVCLRLLTGQPRTRRQLADALRRRGIPDAAAEEVLERFQDVGLIDDAAFAAAWVESRHHGRGLARRALERELRSRGVAGELAAEAVAGLDPEREVETARELAVRKARATRGLAREARIRRLVGMLARRGYPEGLAFRVVREVLTAEGEDADQLGAHFPDA